MFILMPGIGEHYNYGVAVATGSDWYSRYHAQEFDLLATIDTTTGAARAEAQRRLGLLKTKQKTAETMLTAADKYQKGFFNFLDRLYA